MEDDPRDGRAVAAERVLLGRPRDPLGGRALVAGRRAADEFLLGLAQLRFQLVDLRRK